MKEKYKIECRGYCGDFEGPFDGYGYCEECTRDGTHKRINSNDCDIEFYCKENF